MTDTSETYIKMCGCPEVQEGWELKPGDTIYTEWHGYLLMAHCGCTPYYRAINLKGDVVSFGNETEWTALPRQDQIQEMTIELFADIHNLLQNFGLWISANYSPVEKPFWASQEYLKKFSSAEQLWLAFYMHEKHGLTWGGERWE